ncbi:hypothetical protein [Micromonospora sp. KC207]|uniref:hypothetical protein n=1 Tax=Micromonospora sp. KC207 TaxID=2530377 RepID=UPI00352D04D8
MTDGVPVDVVRRVVGHEKASTTLDRYTPDDYADRVRLTFADDSLTFSPSPRPADPENALHLARKGTGKGTTPVGGRRGSSGGSAPGGCEPNRLSGHGGCNRRGSAVARHVNTRRKHKHA